MLKECKHRISKKIAAMQIDEVEEELNALSFELLDTCKELKAELYLLKLSSLLSKNQFEQAMDLASSKILPLVQHKVRGF